MDLPKRRGGVAQAPVVVLVNLSCVIKVRIVCRGLRSGGLRPPAVEDHPQHLLLPIFSYSLHTSSLAILASAAAL